MAWLVPYVINGAAHSAALFRRQAQRPASDKAGVARSGDLKVTQLPSAAGGFRIAQGSLSLPSGFAGRSRESYGVENADAVVDVLDVAGTGSSARSDAVVVEVLDPNYTSITPEDAAAENYTRVVVVQGVSATASSVDDLPGFENRTAYMLARIDWEPGTTAITDAMIVDCRELANPRLHPVIFARPRISSDGDIYLTGTDANGGEFFPGGGSGSPNSFTVKVPEWATRMTIDASWMAVYYQGGKNPYGSYWMEFGDEYRPHTWPNNQQYEFATQKFAFNAPLTSDARTSEWRLMDEVAVPAKLRGKTVTFVFKASRKDTVSGNTQAVYMSSSGGLGCQIMFAEAAAGPDMV